MEYMTGVARPEELEGLFNDYARQGWELVSVSPHMWKTMDLHTGLYEGGHVDVQTYLFVMRRERRP